MEKREGMLMWAGAAAVVGLLLGVAALAIAIIAAVSPPVRESVSGEMRGTDWATIVLQLIAAVAGVALSGGMLASVILRRDVGFAIRPALQPQRQPIGPGVTAFLFLVVFAGCGILLTRSIASLSDIPAGQLAQSRAFLGLPIQLGLMSIASSSMSSRLFVAWRNVQPIAEPAAMATSPHA